MSSIPNLFSWFGSAGELTGSRPNPQQLAQQTSASKTTHVANPAIVAANTASSSSETSASTQSSTPQSSTSIASSSSESPHTDSPILPVESTALPKPTPATTKTEEDSSFLDSLKKLTGMTSAKMQTRKLKKPSNSSSESSSSTSSISSPTTTSTTSSSSGSTDSALTTSSLNTTTSESSSSTSSISSPPTTSTTSSSSGFTPSTSTTPIFFESYFSVSEPENPKAELRKLAETREDPTTSATQKPISISNGDHTEGNPITPDRPPNPVKKAPITTPLSTELHQAFRSNPQQAELDAVLAKGPRVIIPKEQVTKWQKALHTPIAKINYIGSDDGCLAKICRIFKLFIYALFGRHGIFLGRAQDDRVSVQKERANIKKYELELKNFISHINTSSKAEFMSDERTGETVLVEQARIEQLISALQARMNDIITLNPSLSIETLKHTLLADIDQAIDKYNSEDQSRLPISDKDKNHWKSCIEKEWNALCEKDITKRAKGYLEAYAEVITPKFVKNHGLKVVADFSNSYIELFGTEMLIEKGKPIYRRLLLESAAELLRKEVNKKHKDKFEHTIKKLDNALPEMVLIKSNLFYFTQDTVNKEEFINAVFPSGLPSVEK